jgi:hypothetical protein
VFAWKLRFFQAIRGICSSVACQQNSRAPEIAENFRYASETSSAAFGPDAEELDWRGKKLRRLESTARKA